MECVKTFNCCPDDMIEEPHSEACAVVGFDEGKKEPPEEGKDIKA